MSKFLANLWLTLLFSIPLVLVVVGVVMVGWPAVALLVGVVLVVVLTVWAVEKVSKP